MPKKKHELDMATGFQELEQIAAWFERGQPDIEAGLQKFIRAMELSKVLKQRLTEAENTIKSIKTSSV